MPITAYALVNNAQATTYTAAAGEKIASARIRWKGYSYTSTVSSSNTNTGGQSTTFPSVPSGYYHDYHTWSWSVTVRNDTASAVGCNVIWDVAGTQSDGGYVSSIAPGATHTFSDSGSTGSNWVGSPMALTGWSGGVTIVSSSCTARTYGWDYGTTYNSTNVSAVHNGQTITGPSSLNNGVESTWYTVPVAWGATTLGLTHSVTGSNKVYYQLEVTYASIKPTTLEVDGAARQAVSIHTKVDGVLYQAIDTKTKIDGVLK